MAEHQGAPSKARGFFRRGLHWPVCVGIVFLGNIALATWVIVVSSNDPTFAVEEDYYEKALNWNDEIDQRERNVALGRSITLRDTPRLDAEGRCEFTLALVDHGSDPLTGAAVKVRAFPIVRGDEKHDVGLDEVAPGQYAARIEGARPGVWELRIVARLGDDLFTHRIETVVEHAE